MSNQFDEGKIKRASDGKFAEKPHDAAPNDAIGSPEETILNELRNHDGDDVFEDVATKADGFDANATSILAADDPHKTRFVAGGVLYELEDSPYAEPEWRARSYDQSEFEPDFPADEGDPAEPYDIDYPQPRDEDDPERYVSESEIEHPFADIPFEEEDGFYEDDGDYDIDDLYPHLDEDYEISKMEDAYDRMIYGD